MAIRSVCGNYFIFTFSMPPLKCATYCVEKSSLVQVFLLYLLFKLNYSFTCVKFHYLLAMHYRSLYISYMIVGQIKWTSLVAHGAYTFFDFTVRCYAVRGYVTVDCSSVCLYACNVDVLCVIQWSHRWNTSKTILQLIRLRFYKGQPQQQQSGPMRHPQNSGGDRGGVIFEHENLQYFWNEER